MIKHIEKWIHCDLNLDEVAMIQHTFLKKLDIKYETLFMILEKVDYDIADEKNLENPFTTEKYTLVIIASYNKLTKKELIKLIDKLQTNGITRRNDV
jgi:signal recognition particle subunit SEC65